MAVPSSRGPASFILCYVWTPSYDPVYTNQTPSNPDILRLTPNAWALNNSQVVVVAAAAAAVDAVVFFITLLQVRFPTYWRTLRHHNYTVSV